MTEDMKDIYKGAKLYIDDNEVEGIGILEYSAIGIEPEPRENSRLRWSRGFRMIGTATVTPRCEDMTEADKRKVKRAVKKIKGIKKHGKRVANRQKLRRKRNGF